MLPFNLSALFGTPPSEPLYLIHKVVIGEDLLKDGTKVPRIEWRQAHEDVSIGTMINPKHTKTIEFLWVPLREVKRLCGEGA